MWSAQIEILNENKLKHKLAKDFTDRINKCQHGTFNFSMPFTASCVSRYRGNWQHWCHLKKKVTSQQLLHRCSRNSMFYSISASHQMIWRFYCGFHAATIEMRDNHFDRTTWKVEKNVNTDIELWTLAIVLMTNSANFVWYGYYLNHCTSRHVSQIANVWVCVLTDDVLRNKTAKVDSSRIESIRLHFFGQ